MPTEDHITVAGPPSPDAPEVQAALKRVSWGMQHIVMRLAERERRAAAEQPPEDAPPERKKGAAPRPKSAAPCSSSTTVTAGDQTDSKGLCYVQRTM
jgi:hypothetical protein